MLPDSYMKMNKTHEEVSQEYTLLRQKWKQVLTGGDYNLDNPYIQKKVKVLSDRASALYASMVKHEQRHEKPYLWEELQPPLTEESKKDKSSSSFIKISYYWLKDITLAYASKGTSLYGKEDVKQEIISALEYINANWYNDEIQPYGNWWNWDIGSPLALNDIIVLMHDQLSESQVQKNMAAIKFHVPEITTSTGANRVWKGIIIALSGVISKDSDRIAYGRDAINPVLPYVTQGDGFYLDGSFVQHKHYGYTGNYGEALITCLSKLVFLLDKSHWEIVNPLISNMYKWVEDSFEPLMYRGAFMDALRGRQISAYKFYDHTKGLVIIESIAFMSTFAPEPYKTKYQRMVKSWLTDEWYLDYYERSSILGVQQAQDIMNSTLEPREPLVGCYQFAAMDRVLHRRPHFAYMISMHSTRIKNYEQINKQNLRGWHTGDGMTYLYNKDLTRFADAFWPTVDSHRLPGTTAKYGEEVIPKTHSDQDFAGGCQLKGIYGVAGMELHPVGSDLRAKKSWFLLDNEVVAIGSDIKRDETTVMEGVETIIDNYKLKDDGTNQIHIDGELLDVSKRECVIEGTPLWIHMEGNVTDSEVGYYLPSGQHINCMWQKREDSFSSIDKYDIVHDELFTKSYFTIWKDHQQQSDYAYVVLPGYTKEGVRDYAQNPEVEILHQSNQLHAIKKESLGILAANVWVDEEVAIEGISCKGIGSYMFMETDQGMNIAVSDPTWKSSMTEIVIKGQFKEVKTLSQNVKVELLMNSVKLMIDMTERQGQTCEISLLGEAK